MKTYILIAFTLIASLAMNAQNDVPIIGNRVTFGVDGGLSSPGSDFATAYSGLTTNQNNLSGSAQNGYYMDIYGGVRLIGALGVMVQYGVNNNSFNSSNLSSGSSASGGYTTAEYLAGPYLSFPLGEFKLELKLLGGDVTNNYPTISTTTYGNSVVDAFKNGSGFGYCAGAKLKYMLGALGIGVGLNYVSSDVSYSVQKPNRMEVLI
jgi:hypothetical protein